MAITQDLDQDDSIVSGMEFEEFDVIVVGAGALVLELGSLCYTLELRTS